MAIYKEFVTRQMADKITGAPITGGDFQLRDVFGIDLDISMTECTDPLYPGRYTSGLEARAGIWVVQRRTTGAYEDTGEFITVGPGRTPAGLIGSEEDYSCTDIVLTDCVHAAAFVPIDAATPTLAHLQAAVDYAAINGIRKVYVGLYKGSPDCAGSSSLSLSAIDGILLDLGGARIKVNTPGTPVISMTYGTIMFGTIEGSGTNSCPEIEASTDGFSPVYCYGVDFPRDLVVGASSATVQMGGGPVAAIFIQCRNHKLQYQAPSTDPLTGVSRLQRSDTICVQAGPAGFIAYTPAEDANVDGSILGLLVNELLTSDETSAPLATVAPFASAQTASQAAKHLWFVQNPKVNAMWTGSVIADRQIFSGAGKAIMTPTAIFAPHETGGSEDTAENFFYHKDGATITDTENGAASAIGFRLDSGIVVDKVYRGSDTKYEKICMSLYAFFSPATIVGIVTGDPAYVDMIGWIPRKFQIQTSAMTNLFMDKDGTPFLFPTNVIDVRATICQQSPLSGFNTETVGLCGNAALSGTLIDIEMGPLGVPLSDLFQEYLRRLSGQALSVPGGSGNFIGVKLDLSFINTARTDLPRFF